MLRGRKQLDERQARFADNSQQLKSFEGKHRIAHDGGKFRTNKEEVLLKFFAKQGKDLDNLTVHEQAALTAARKTSNNGTICSSQEMHCERAEAAETARPKPLKQKNTNLAPKPAPGGRKITIPKSSNNKSAAVPMANMVPMTKAQKKNNKRRNAKKEQRESAHSEFLNLMQHA